MTRGILYMLTGIKHAAQLTVSLFSLRRHYDGPVAILAGCDLSAEFASLCYKTFQPFEIIRWTAPTKGSRKQHAEFLKANNPDITAEELSAAIGPKIHQQANKPDMIRLSPFDQTIFLDADTLVVNSIDTLWPRKGTEEIRLTQFANWDTQEHHIKRRVESWREYCPVQAARMLAHRYPGINTGILSFSNLSTAFAKRWKEVTMLKPSFMCDELAAQLIFADFPHMVLDDRWNCSAIHSWSRLGLPSDVLTERAATYRVQGESIVPDERLRVLRQNTGGRSESVVIWHGHGWKFVKHPAGRAVWWPTFEECRRSVEWLPQYIAADGKLSAYLEKPSTYS